MKKISLILALLMVLACVLTGCNRDAKPETTTAATTTAATTTAADDTAAIDLSATDPGEFAMAGGWTAESAVPGTLPSNAYSAFEEAVKGWEGEKPTALACIGEQCVAGSNYAILCRNGAKLAILYLYDPLDGDATVTGSAEYTVSDFVRIPAADTGAGTDEPVTGGWYTPEYGALTEADSRVFEVFNKAMEGLDGVAYEPLACIGTQVVAGINYAFVCRGTGVYPGAQPNTYIVTIYADLSGNAAVDTITLIHAEDLIPAA